MGVGIAPNSGYRHSEFTMCADLAASLICESTKLGWPRPDQEMP